LRTKERTWKKVLRAGAQIELSEARDPFFPKGDRPGADESLMGRQSEEKVVEKKSVKWKSRKCDTQRV
jgi:hypothetical protein